MRRSQPISRLAAALTLGAALAAPVRGWAEPPAPAQAQPLRVCADPDNLPFSSAKSAEPGFYIELAQQIAQSLGRPMEPVWSLSYFGARTVRTTLLAKTCDLYVGLPRGGFMGPSLILSKPFLHVGYAVTAPAGQHIDHIGDLAGKRVAVQFSTPPQTVLAARDDVTSVTVLNPEEAMQDLAQHKVDAAFIWGPSAGYINATALHGAFDVTPIAGDGMQYPVAIGFNRADTALRGEVDRFIDANGGTITALVAKYGLPTVAPVRLANTAHRLKPGFILAATMETVDQARSTQPAAPADQQKDIQHANATATADVSADAAKSSGSGEPTQIAAQGHDIFNGTCAHCHGPDAVQSEKKIDLRLLHRRYGNEMESVFHTTVTKGRPSKGMPNWSGVFSEEDFQKIFAFLKTVQTN